MFRNYGASRVEHWRKSDLTAWLAEAALDSVAVRCGLRRGRPERLASDRLSGDRPASSRTDLDDAAGPRRHTEWQRKECPPVEESEPSRHGARTHRDTRSCLARGALET